MQRWQMQKGDKCESDVLIHGTDNFQFSTRGYFVIRNSISCFRWTFAKNVSGKGNRLKVQDWFVLYVTNGFRQIVCVSCFVLLSRY